MSLIISKCCWCDSPLIQQKWLGADVWRCPMRECFDRQAAYAITVTKTIGKRQKQECLYLPLPKQALAHEVVDAGVKHVLYGGAAGGSKSHFLRYLAYHACLKHPGTHVLLLRRTFPELESTHIHAAELEAPRFGERCYPSRFVLPFEHTGSVLRFGHCQEKSDFIKHLSTEYDLILFDELVTFEEEMFLMISSRARSSHPHWRGKEVVAAGTNPGGPFSAWVVQRWIEKTLDLEKYPDFDPADYLYIQATLDDNPYIDQASYEKRLMALPEELRKAYREGRWDIFPGQYFKEWRREKHVVDLGTIPAYVLRYRAIDWGRFKPGVVGWFASLPDGRLYMEHEWKFEGLNPTQVAHEIRKLTLGWYGGTPNLHSTSADPSMWIRQSESGESIAETFLRAGVPLVPANHERVNGWNRVHEWLASAPDGQPWLIFHPDCHYTIRTLPAQIQDPKRLEDVDTDGEDHAADMLRYLVMMRPAPSAKPGAAALPPDSAGAMMQQLIRGQQTYLGAEAVRAYGR